ncbi:MAG: hypothetical protein Q9160_002002 [Pyrenula sp. 1 TL-2023]
MAQRAGTRLHDHGDQLQASYFERLFKKPPNQDQSLFETVEDIIGLDEHSYHGPFGIAGLRPVSTGERADADLRIFCDNDRKDPRPGARTRWKLRPDPIENSNPNYVPQRQRPEYDPNSPNGWYREWWDETNGIIMGKSGGCGDSKTQAITYVKSASKPAAGPVNRVTMTLRGRFHTIASLPDATDFTGLNEYRLPTNIASNNYPTRGGIDFLSAFTSFVILHEPPRGPSEETAYGWRNINAISEAGAEFNADTYAYFCLLAKLQDRGFRISEDPDDSYDGDLKKINKRKRQSPSRALSLADPVLVPRNCVDGKAGGADGLVCRKLRA